MLLAAFLPAQQAGGGPKPEAAEAKTQNSKVRGITISTHGNGRDWGTDRIVPAISEIKELGGNWICVHPYARINANGQVSFRAWAEENPPQHLLRPIREAHAQGMKVLIKPHLAYWGSPFSWRGEITFAEAEQWDRFFSSYQSWITKVARACKEADGFAVGTELDKTIQHDKAWRQIITAVRLETPAALTYAANWTDYQRVGFWDALDTIGIQAYFPLADKVGASQEELQKGWAKVMAKLRPFAKKLNRKIVFTELGYNNAHRAPIEPWDHRSDGPGAESVQVMCMHIALGAVEAEPLVVGAFLWKWFVPPFRNGRNFALATPIMKETITQSWHAQSSPK